MGKFGDAIFERIIQMFKPLCTSVLAVLALAATLSAAPVILNEYNAVSSDGYLGGGTASADESGGRAFDTYFGRVLGNGGDWFELVVITDHLDMRNWMLDIYSDGLLDETINLTNHPLWADLRAGTIITVSEDVPDDVSYDPAGGDWWINVQASDSASGTYIENSSFPVGSSNWQLRIRNAAGTIVFGPAGEGVSPASGISGSEVFRLEADPSASITAASGDYDDADDLSTFGAPNQWGMQAFADLRIVTPPFSTVAVASPNGGEIIQAGDVVNITWTSTGMTSADVEFSADAGLTWTAVYPPNAGNAGAYAWLVPAIDSETVLVRVSNAGDPGAADTSDAVFAVYPCALAADVTGDCTVDLDDLAALAANWLDCANPYGCQ